MLPDGFLHPHVLCHQLRGDFTLIVQTRKKLNLMWLERKQAGVLTN